MKSASVKAVQSPYITVHNMPIDIPTPQNTKMHSKSNF